MRNIYIEVLIANLPNQKMYIPQKELIKIETENKISYYTTGEFIKERLHRDTEREREH